LPVELTEERITNFMTRVRQTAERGERQILVLRFPSELCTDSGRAINNNLSGWENTLVGLPKQMLEVWRGGLEPLAVGLPASAPRCSTTRTGCPAISGCFVTGEDAFRADQNVMGSVDVNSREIADKWSGRQQGASRA